MSTISIDEVKKLAKLSAIKVEDDEIDGLRQELENILQYVDKLKDINVEGVEPTIQVSRQQNVFREDVVKDQNTQDELLKNVPEVQSGYIKVPKVL